MTDPRGAPAARENTPPPPYSEHPTIYPANVLAASDYRCAQPNAAGCILVPRVVPVGPFLLGPRSVRMICPSCQQEILTRVENSPTNEAWLCCMLAFVLGCFLFSCLPFCMDSCHKVDHICPSCTYYIGSYVP